MYHHHPQQQGTQPFSNGPRPPHHQPPPNQHQNRPSTDMLSQVMGFQFPRPTQLPDELESALAIRGGRDMDHRLIDNMSRPNQHQNQSSGSGISQHGSYGSDNQSSHQQGIDWSSYQPPTKLFAGPPPSTSHQAQRHQGPQQQPPQSSHTGTSIPSWSAPANDSPSPQTRLALGGGSGSGGTGGEGQGLYTPESAGSILASFGLSNDDLEVLSHYPDDQLTPDTLPFILRDIQINKSGNQKTVVSSSSSSFSLPPSCSSPLARSGSPEVPSLLTVTQTAGKVIDYGHASRAKEESSNRETFKREPLSSERTVKMYPSLSSSSSTQKVDKAERRQVRLEPTESGKHGDRDYRRSSSDHRKSNRSPGREFPPSTKSRNLDQDYRREGLKPRPSSETRSDSSRRSLSSSSGSKPQHSNKKLPTPTMISDFSAVSPKVYPHTCSLCHTQCDQEKDWVDHINTVNHTAACRDLRNKYPSWKPNLPSRSGRYGSRALWNPKDGSPSLSVSRSLSGSPTPSPPRSKHRAEPHLQRPHGRPYSPHHHPHHPHYNEHSIQLEHRHSGSHRISSSSREHRPDRRDGDSTGGFYRSSGKFSTGMGRRPSSSKAGHSFKHGPSQSFTKTVKGGIKPGTKITKGIAKPPPAKKKKKLVAPACDSSVADRLVYLTGIPKDASEQEVTDLVGFFGKINNVILMPCSDAESDIGEGQKASVCMVTAEGAQALASSTNLSIREQRITASLAKKPDVWQSSDANSKPKPKPPGQDKSTAGKDLGGDAEQKTSDEKGVVMITGLPASGWSESDIIHLVQPFGSPSDIVLATDIGKVLVSVPDDEIAQEMIKVHTFIPMKIMDSELKMIHVKQSISLRTPVALYNLLMGSLDPLESPALVAWSSLLVISNVPNTLTGSSEVQKLVRRFGTVIKTLVLNSMVICEMATPAMALSVYKRFQRFPCVIHNNPLFFSRKPDPKNNQTKVIAAYVESSEDKPAHGKGNQTAAAEAKERTASKLESQSPLEGPEKDVTEGDENIKGSGKTDGEAVGENSRKDEDSKKDDLTGVPDFVAAPDAKADADPETDVKVTSAFETVMEMAAEKESDNASKAEIDKTPSEEETKPASCDDKTVSHEVAMPEFPKVTQEMVNLLLVQCRTRTASNSNSTAPTDDEGGTQLETQPSQGAAETKDTAKSIKEEEELVKRQEREQKDREARKEREARERERKEKERRAWEKEERIRKDRERDERARRDRERREDERRERERRDRKRAYGESFSGSRSSHRSDGYRHSSWREERHHESEDDTKDVEESDDFPFNMSDFVTVDEVGDVTDLPSPAVPMETEEGKDAPESKEVTPTEAKVSTTAAKLVESEPATLSTANTCATMVSQNLKPDLVVTAAVPPSPGLQTDLSPGETPVATCQLEVPETETILRAALDSTNQVESSPAPASTPAPAITPTPTPAPAPAPAPTSSPTPTPTPTPAPAPAPTSSPTPTPGPAESSPNGLGIVESEKGESEQTAVGHRQNKEEQELEPVTGKEEKNDKVQDEEDKERVALPEETGKHERSEDQTNPEEESVRKKLKTEAPMNTDIVLPPYNPSNPVGMEFLVPKTGFFCKVCNRFFSGAKEAEINHCKTLKHYENMQKYLETTKKTNVTTKRNSNSMNSD